MHRRPDDRRLVKLSIMSCTATADFCWEESPELKMNLVWTRLIALPDSPPAMASLQPSPAPGCNRPSFVTTGSKYGTSQGRSSIVESN